MRQRSRPAGRGGRRDGRSGTRLLHAALEAFLTNMSPDMREEVPVRAT